MDKEIQFYFSIPKYYPEDSNEENLLEIVKNNIDKDSILNYYKNNHLFYKKDGMVIALSEIYLTISDKNLNLPIEKYIDFCLKEYYFIKKLYDSKLPNPYEIKIFTCKYFIDIIINQLNELNIEYRLVELSNDNISITLYSKVKFY